MDENRGKALAAALSQIEKQFGKGSIMRLGEHDVARDIQVVSTGSLGLDLALGVGGLPRGRVDRGGAASAGREAHRPEPEGHHRGQAAGVATHSAGHTR